MTKTLISTVFLLALPTLALAEPPEKDGPPPEMHELMEQIKEKYPEKWAHLKRLRKENPRKFRQQLMQIRRHMLRGAEDPEIQERMAAAKEMYARFKEKVEAYESATGKDKEKLHEALLELAGEMFDAKQASRKRRLERAKDRIEDLEEEITQREEKREELIDEFVDDATGDSLQGL